jgi:hypothetical protein
MIVRARRWLQVPEVIGAPDCPLMLRWTIISDDPAEALLPLPKKLTGDRKLMVHRFLPNVEDRDPHDHPRGFWTLVLRCGYWDLVPCPDCGGIPVVMQMPPGECELCKNAGVVVGDVMRAGVIRYRAAEHTHITQSGPRGAWTVVLMGPMERPWGFLRQGRWWAFRSYEAAFGFAHRCPTDEEMEGRMLKYTDDGVVVKDA